MVKIEDATGIAWEESPVELIHSLIKSIPPELAPKCHYMTRILHPDSSGPNFPEFQLVVHPPSYQTVTAMGKFATCSVHLAISREGYRKVPIEYRIFYYIGIEWLGSYEKYDENNEDEIEHRINEYATVCFVNYIQSKNIASGFHGDFPPGFVQRKIEEARKIVSARSYFPWPDTLVADNSTGMLSEVNWPREGMLKYKGYSVGSFSNITYEDDRLQARRDQPKFLNLCKAVAFLNQMKKPLKNYNGIEYIEVDRQDIQQATELASELLGISLDDLSLPARNLLQRLLELPRTFTRKEVMDHTGWTKTRLHIHLTELMEMELVLPEPSKKGQLQAYKLLYNGEGQDGKRFLIGLNH